MVRILESDEKLLDHQGCVFREDIGSWPLPVTLFDTWIP